MNVSSPTKETKLVCIGKPDIAPVNNEIRFKDALIDQVNHLWVDVSPVKSMPHAIGQKVETVAKVYSYERKDGSISYSIQLIENNFYLEAGLVMQMMDYFRELSRDCYSLEQRVATVDDIISETKKLLADGQIVLFSKTSDELIKFLDDNRGALMQQAAVHVTLNREGRRLSRRPRSRCRQQTTAMGFA